MAAGEEEEEVRAHPDCRNASNPHHECNDFCFRFIADAKKSKEKERLGRGGSDDDTVQGNTEPVFASSGRASEEEGPCPDDDDSDDDQRKNEPVFALTGRQKKLAELERKMKEARKANEHDVEAEEKRSVAAPETRGISKKQWLEERKKKLGRLLDANGLDISKSYMLDTQEAAEQKYKKWEKEPAPYGWDVFNQKSLYNAYKKRTKNIQCDMEEYKKLSDADPEFYRDASSLQYGKASRVSEDKIDNMVDELKNREDKRKAFSRRRKFHDEKDIDSINDRNEHFNKKIERAFGKYTIEIKNNLERGTALPD